MEIISKIAPGCYFCTEFKCLGGSWFGGRNAAAAAGSAAAVAQPRLVRRPRRGGRGWFVGRGAAAVAASATAAGAANYGGFGAPVIGGEGGISSHR